MATSSACPISTPGSVDWPLLQLVTSFSMPQPPLSPSWHEINVDTRGTLVHIPRGALPVVTKMYVRLVHWFVHEPGWESFHALWAFPKSVLAPLKRAGRSHWNLVGRQVSRRATDYLQRPVAESWKEAGLPAVKSTPMTRKRARNQGDVDMERLTARIERLVGNGAPGKASRLLLSKGVFDPTDPSVATALQSLHPHHPPHGRSSTPFAEDDLLIRDGSSEGVQDRLDDLYKAIRSFEPESAAGPSGLRPDHLRDMVFDRVLPQASELLLALDAFIGLVLTEGLPAGIAPRFAAAKLTALRKTATVQQTPGPGTSAADVRPIAAGETLRRLAGKVLMRAPQTVDRLKTLRPSQLGVGVSDPCTSVAMALQQQVDVLTMAGEGDWAILQVDCRNAFNCLNRSVMLQAFQARCPEALPYIETCYAEVSPLYFGQKVLLSAAGVQQGDPVGPAAFALGLQGVVEQVSPMVDWQAWYLDDGHLRGTLPQLQAALAFIHRATADLGIDVNLAKCRLWGPAVAGGHPTTLQGSSVLRRVPVVTMGAGSGLKVLGCPVSSPGDTTFAASLWDPRVSEVNMACDVLRQVGSSHVQFCLLRLCLSACKVNDLMRTTPLPAAEEQVRCLSKCLRDTCGFIHGGPISDAQWLQATIPSRLGGLGIRDPQYERAAARLAGIVGYLTKGHHVVEYTGFEAIAPPDLPTVLAAVLHMSWPTSQPATAWAADLSLVAHAEPSHASQHFWGNLLATSRQTYLSTVLQGDDAVRFESQKSPHAMAWVNVIPSRPLRTLLPTEEFRSVLKWHLGTPQSLSPGPHLCPQCQLNMDTVGHHLCCCKSNQRMRRHGAVQDFLLRFVMRAGFSARREQMASDRTRPGDIFIHRWNADGPAAIDVSVRHTLRPSGPVKSPGAVGAWFLTQEAQKHSKYDAQASRCGWQFTAFIMDCYGALGLEARNFMSGCLKLLLGQTAVGSRRKVEDDVWGGLSLTLARELGRQLVQHRYATPSGPDEDGDDEPVGIGGGSHRPYGPP